MKKKRLSYLILIFMAIIIVGVVFLLVKKSVTKSFPDSTLVESSEVSIPTTPEENNQNDECDVGKEIISASELENYDCEGLEGCEWWILGGKNELQYACCPKGLDYTNETMEVYNRCFVIID